jgi:hypothetical protein
MSMFTGRPETTAATTASDEASHRDGGEYDEYDHSNDSRPIVITTTFAAGAGGRATTVTSRGGRANIGSETVRTATRPHTATATSRSAHWLSLGVSDAIGAPLDAVGDKHLDRLMETARSDNERDRYVRTFKRVFITACLSPA